MKFSPIKGYLLIAAAALIWGTNGIFSRFIDLPTPVMLFYRYLIGFVILFFYLFKRDGKITYPKVNLKGIITLGVFNTLLSLTGFYAFINTSIANAEILLYTYPVYVLILSPFILKEKIERSTVPVLIIAFLGLILLVISGGMTSGGNNIGGIVSGFVAGIFFALYVLSAKKVSHNLDVMLMNCYQQAVTVIILLPFLFIFTYHLDSKNIFLLFMIGLFHSAIAASLYFSGIKIVKAQHVGIISYLEPLSGVVFAALLLHEIPGILTLLGGVLILFSGYRLVTAKN